MLQECRVYEGGGSGICEKRVGYMWWVGRVYVVVRNRVYGVVLGVGYMRWVGRVYAEGGSGILG